MIFTFKFKTEDTETNFTLDIEKQEENTVKQNIVLAQTKFSNSVTYTSQNLLDTFINEVLDCYTNNTVKSIEVIYDDMCIGLYNAPDLRVYMTSENDILHKRVEIISAK